MLKNGMFIMALGFIALILGLTEPNESRVWTLVVAFFCIVVGFVLYSRAEKDKTKEDE